MSKQKLRVANTELDNLVSNLRGEVGEVVTGWVALRRLMISARQMSVGDPTSDLNNSELAFVRLIEQKLEDELIGRLSELAERKIGQLTFFFASEKLDALTQEVDKFERFIIKSGIRVKRNLDVSHKTLPEKWTEHRLRFIDYPVLLRAISMAVRLMKRIDRVTLGPSALYCWREARKKRYELMMPPSAAYMLLPHLRLSGDDRVRILQQELDEGRSALEVIETRIDGKPGRLLANKRWAVLVFGDRAVPLEHYPLQELKEISFGTPESEDEQVVDARADTTQPNKPVQPAGKIAGG